MFSRRPRPKRTLPRICIANEAPSPPPERNVLQFGLTKEEPETARIRFRAWGVASVPYFPANIASALALTELPSALNPLYLSATLYALTNSSRDVPFFPAACASLRKSL